MPQLVGCDLEYEIVSAVGLQYYEKSIHMWYMARMCMAALVADARIWWGCTNVERSGAYACYSTLWACAPALIADN